ncbi:MAG: tetratricopeptide repeat protein [Elusimicrobia bacterium]|nr:tetratricopeptide repeat protein [Elusimicrobiota bacterium]
MGTHWIREEIKKDWLGEHTEKALAWLKNNRQYAMGTLVAIIAAAIASYYISVKIAAKDDAAWEKFYFAQKAVYSANLEQGIKELDELAAAFSSSKAAGYGLLLKGDILFSQGKAKEAAEIYKPLAAKNKPLISELAYSGLCASLEAQNNFSEVISSAEEFLRKYPGHFLAAQIESFRARAQDLLGKTDEAKISYERIYTMFPNTYWGQSAKLKLDSMKK